MGFLECAERLKGAFLVVIKAICEMKSPFLNIYIGNNCQSPACNMFAILCDILTMPKVPSRRAPLSPTVLICFTVSVYFMSKGIANLIVSDFLAHTSCIIRVLKVALGGIRFPICIYRLREHCNFIYGNTKLLSNQ